MKSLKSLALVAGLAAACGVSARAQGVFVPGEDSPLYSSVVSVDPSGSCTKASQQKVNYLTGHTWGCVGTPGSMVWSDLTASPVGSIAVNSALGLNKVKFDPYCSGWTLTGGWSCSAGHLVLNDTGAGGTASYTVAGQTVGSTYQSFVTPSAIGSYPVNVNHCGNQLLSLLHSASPGTSNYTCTNSDPFTISANGNAGGTATITGVSVLPVTGGTLSAQTATFGGVQYPAANDYQLHASAASSLSLANQTVISRFEGGAGTEWVQSSGTGPVNDTINTLNNAQSILLSSVSGAANKMDRVGSFNLTGAVAMRMQFYVDNVASLVAGGSAFNLYLSNSNYASYYLCSVHPSGVSAGWNDISIPLNTCTTTGSPSLASVDRFRLWAQAGTGTSVNVSFALLSAVKNPNTQATILLTFDDGYTSHWATVRPTLWQYQFPATLFQISNWVNQAFSMTTGQIQSLQNAYGWDVACHTSDHQQLNTLPNAAAVDTVITRYFDWATANGIAHVPVIAYPYGSHSNLVDTEVAKYFLLGRTTASNSNMPAVIDPTTSPYNQFVQILMGPSSQTSLATAEGWVDAAVSNNSVLILVFHNIIATPVISTDWDTADFQSLMAYISTKVTAGTARVITYSQLIAQYYPGFSTRNGK